MQKRKIVFVSTVLGNILDHYDVALYAFLAPFLSTIFFDHSDPIVALIMTYGLMSTNVITRSIGSIFFGKMASSRGAPQTLVITLFGVTVTTFCIGLVPGYDQLGFLAPILLCLVRMLQGLFASGEIAIASLFILEQCDDENHSKASSYYLCSTMLGITIASWVATIVSESSNPGYYWRYAFFGSAFTGLVGLWLRFLFKDIKHTALKSEPRQVNAIVMNKWKILRIILVSGFSFMTYAVPFIFLNKFVPILQPITDSEMLMHNSLLLTIDIMLLPLFGHLARRFDYSKWMACMSFLFFISIIPIFIFLPSVPLIVVTFLKLWLVILGAAFAAPLNAWFFKMLATREKYMIMGFGYSLGTELLGRNTTAICFSLWYYFAHPIAPAMYIALVSILATCALIFSHSKDNYAH